MPVMFHYTDQAGYNAIKATVDWCFHARQPPPRDHPVGAYFTILPPTTGKLAKRLRIPARKVEYFFSFTAGNELKPLMGDRGDYIYYSPGNYVASKSQQLGLGESRSWKSVEST